MISRHFAHVHEERIHGHSSVIVADLEHKRDRLIDILGPRRECQQPIEG